MKNKFCDFSVLRNESDVEQFFIIRLIKYLGFKDSDIYTKKTITIKKIGKGKNKKEYRPDSSSFFISRNDPFKVVKGLS